MSILLSPGQRGIIIGQTGSGKTIGSIWLMQHIPIEPVIILDTKGEPSFDHIGRDDERVIHFDSAEEFTKAWKKDINAEYIIVRPDPTEIAEPLEMDDCLQEIYNKRRRCLVYIDEAYQWHIRGQAGPGLISLLTRGRSLKISALLSTQRPAWISRFCFTESQRFYIYRIQDLRDRKTISEYVPDFSDKKIAQKYHFYYYDYEQDSARLYSPVPMPEKKAAVGKRERWIT